MLTCLKQVLKLLTCCDSWGDGGSHDRLMINHCNIKTASSTLMDLHSLYFVS